MDTASHSISPEQLSALLGSADAPLVLDVRREERFRESQRLLPGARRCAPEQVAGFAAANGPAQVVVYCVHGLEVGEQAAAQLRAAGWNARYLQGGIEGVIETTAMPHHPQAAGPGRDRRAAVALDHARAAQDRPHRLPLARSPLHRSARASFSMCRPKQVFAGSGPVEGGPLRHPRRADFPRRGAVQLRYPAARVRAATAGPATPGDHRARRRHRPALAGTAGGGAAGGVAGPVAAACRRRPGDAGRGDAGVRRAVRSGAAAARGKRTAGACLRRRRQPNEGGELWRSAEVLAQARLHQLRRAGRADRDHAPRTGGAEALDLGAALPACAQLLHALARPRGAAAGHLHRLADAPHLGRHRGGCAVRAALAVHPHRTELGLRGLRRGELGGRDLLRHQARRRRHRPAGGVAHRRAHAQESAQGAAAVGDLGAELRRHRSAEDTFPLGGACGGRRGSPGRQVPARAIRRGRRPCGGPG